MTTTTVPQQIKSLPTFTPPPSFVAEVDGNPIKVELVNIGPDIAAEMLTHNRNNRNARDRAVKLYTKDMLDGAWQFTGAPITFAADGRLLDGQHRLLAIVASGTTQPIIVVRGLEAEAQDDTDNGIPRKFFDVLHLRGEANANHLAALIRRIAGWEAGNHRNVASYPASTATLLRTLEAHPEARELIHPARKVSNGCDLPASVVGIAWWVCQQIDPDDADFFFERLGDGQGLVKGNPIFELRRTVANSKNVRGERSQTYLLAITLKAWNAYRQGETVGLYRWRPGGAKPEAFPEPI